MTLKLDVWHWKTIGHLFYATSSFVHHSVTIGELKLELQSGNAKFGSNSTIFRAVWPWNLTDDLEKQKVPLHATSSFVHHLVAICEFKLELQSGNAQLKVKIDDFLSRVTFQFYVWPWKTIWHLFYAASSFVHHFVAIGEFKLESHSGNVQMGQNRRFFSRVTLQFDIWPWKTIGHLSMLLQALCVIS